MDIRVNDRDVRDVLDLVKNIIDKFGPRPAGSETCRKSAGEIGRLLEPLSDQVEQQAMGLHPGVMWGMGPIIGGCNTVAVLFLLLGGAWVWAAAVFSTASIIYWIVSIVLIKGAFDFLFPKAEGLNVWGTIEPEGEVHRQIFVVGHHDSARAMTYLMYAQKWYGVRVIGAIVFCFATLFSAWAWAVHRALYGADPAWGAWVVGVLLFGLVFVVPLIFFSSRRFSPGAGDNIVACAIGVVIARIVRGKEGKGRLWHTRLVVLSVDGEEIGFRGAAAFIRAHKRELLGTKTYVLNFDSIYKKCDLRLITRDRNGFEPLSAVMLDECQKIGQRLGHEIARGPVTFSGGGTDATEFAAVGIEAASFIGVPTDIVREGLVYHTLNDTPDHIEPGAVKACLEIAINYIYDKDGE